MRIFLLLSLFVPSIVSAQVTDNFSDGNFTSAPVWSGDGTEFIVNASQQLQLNNTIAGASYLSAASPASSLNNIQWNFYIKQTFAPSSSNYGRVYLASDQANLEGSLNGYYLQFGEAGSTDAVELFRQTGTISTSVARGINGEIAASFVLGIKVTRNASGSWSLYVDPAGGTAYALEATGTDNTYTTTGFFGVATVYTISNITKFFFDDFYNGALIVDVTPPSIVSSTVISNTQLDVLFNENVEPVTSQTLANYTANNGLGNPSSAVRDAGNFSLVHLTFATPFTNALLNMLTVNNVQDLSANAITIATTNFTYFAPITASYKDLIINEIFADPTPQVALPLLEFIEIYNRGTNTFNLNGWKFTDGSTTSTLSNYNLASGQYLIICSNADTASFSPYGNTLGVGTLPSLNNAGDNLKLMDNSLVVIDSVDYSDTWYQDAVKKNGGWTLELINPNSPASCAVSTNWIASTNVNGGTPGTLNSVYSTAIDVTAPSIASVTIIDATHITVCYSEAVDVSQIGTAGNYSINNSIGTAVSATESATYTCVDLTLGTPLIPSVTYTITISNIADCSGNALSPNASNFTYVVPAVAVYKDVIINELMADETPQVGLPAFEFIEIFNRSTNSFNLGGWKFTDGSTTATLSNYNLVPNQYLIICPIADTALFSPFGNTMGVSTFPSLNNSGDNLKFLNSALTNIDSVNYSDTWYQDAVKKNGGWTLELINPNAPAGCPQSNNWIVSTNINGGTPGIQNSVYSTALDIVAPSIASVSVIDATHITVCFSEAVDASQIATTSNYSINNGIGTPSSAIGNATLTCVDLVLSTALNSSATYIISISNMTDCSGNALNPSTATFNYYVVKPFDVVINEIMADPDPVVNMLPDYEYAELYNKTAFPVDLNNWTFTSGTNTKVLSGIIIGAHNFVTLTSTTAAPLFPVSANAIGVTSFPSLTNTGQTLILKNAQGAIISTVAYTDLWYQDANKKNGGYSLEQIDPNNPCAMMNNWRASNNSNGGTPGFQNSIYAANADNAAPQVVRVSVRAIDTLQLYFNEPLDSTTMLNPAIYTINNSIGIPTQVVPIGPDFKSVRLTLGNTLQSGIIYTITVNNVITDCVGNPIGADNSARFALPQPAAANDIVINEILFDPNAGGVDFVEIYNRSNKVIDLGTMQLSQFDTINNVPINGENISSEGFLIFPGDYLLLSENGNAVKSQYNTINPDAFLDMSNLPTMNISGGTVCLASASAVIDHFTYYANMQFPLLNVTKGVSLERIDFNRPTQDRTNWHSAAEAVGFATPGYKNSQYNDAGASVDNAIEITPEVFSPDEDGINDVVNINYLFDTPGFVANVTIYDSRGRLVKYLVRNELLGTKGTWSWDGINEEHEKARIGIYIIFTEVFDLSGKVKHYKKTCVLAGKLD